ncbi:MAG: hypothetical protein ABW157_08965 [Candidatus Thiodiazotropha sp. LLP2]
MIRTSAHSMGFNPHTIFHNLSNFFTNPIRYRFSIKEWRRQVIETVYYFKAGTNNADNKTMLAYLKPAELGTQPLTSRILS